ncbi:MAG TPA: hypothetical protein PLQ15_05525 [Syntrophales bacterium]|nr:hypothetical protein [Syntrophales bacterium]
MKHVKQAQREHVLAFREEVLALPVIDGCARDGSSTAWLNARMELRRQVLEGNPLRFLNWDVVTGSMFVGNRPFIDIELRYLTKLPDWKRIWEGILVEDPVGDPKPYKGYRRSSGNRIHQAYHLARFEQEAGMPVNRFPLIVEFGGGYGSLCRIIHKLGFQGRYVIFDLPEFTALQKFYLGLLGMPVVREKDAVSGDSGIYCMSELPELGFTTQKEATHGLFIATWSLSETEESLRQHIVKLPAVDSAAAYLIAYQNDFEGIDNTHFFDAWLKSKPDIRWVQSEIAHMPGNYYLFGHKVLS